MYSVLETEQLQVVTHNFHYIDIVNYGIVNWEICADKYPLFCLLLKYISLYHSIALAVTPSKHFALFWESGERVSWRNDILIFLISHFWVVCDPRSSSTPGHGNLTPTKLLWAHYYHQLPQNMSVNMVPSTHVIYHKES